MIFKKHSRGINVYHIQKLQCSLIVLNFGNSKGDEIIEI